jgi:hypothetical protein
MTDADVFAKLSRIIETQDFSDNEPVESLLESLASSELKDTESPPRDRDRDRDRVTFDPSISAKTKR